MPGYPIWHARLARVARALSVGSTMLAGALTALLVVLITYVVWQRFVAAATPRWAEELPRLVLVWAAFVGAVACSHERTHLVAGMLPWLIRSHRARRVIARINHAVIMLGLTVLGYAGWQMADLTMTQTLTALDVPAGWVYLAVPVACAASVWVHLVHCCAPASVKEED